MPKEHRLQIIPLGGLGEVGKNMTVIRFENQILVIDAGLAFPEDDMLGIDLVIPDYSYLVENQDMVLGIIITHGHEDHIGTLPYLLRDLHVPVFATKLTSGLIEAKLQESNGRLMGNVVEPGDLVRLGDFKVEFIRVNHSIPDCVGLAIHTPLGTIVHSGDFKMDHTPVSGDILDVAKFSELGKKGVLCLLSDSTNAERPGFTQSEADVGRVLNHAFQSAKERVILASFASNINRIQQVISAAVLTNRKVAIMGRSMLNYATIAAELGYLTVPDGILLSEDEILTLPPNEVCIVMTGSQGEPMSALTRIAMNDHKKMEIQPGDTVIISANPVPGNEKSVSRTVDQLFRQGANVIHGSSSGVHVSGHASQEDLKLLLNIVRPKYFIPVHGEYRMLINHGKIAEKLGIPSENIFIAENGSVIEFTRRGAGMTGKVSAGKILVDGLGVGDVGNIVLRDRKQLAQEGILIVVLTINRATCEIVAGPDVVTRGFVYVRESESMLDEAREKARQAAEKCLEGGVVEWVAMKNQVRDTLNKHFYEKTRRRPMILPIIQEVKLGEGKAGDVRAAEAKLSEAL
ncbi:MAG: ribonuclease J [Peptococcaceae bacterium]|nr:ribonuclease J [Peptococcaceae bacterium]